jgi:predicted PurR-regulated permease PerM
MRSSLLPLPADPRLRRLLVLALFVGLLMLFRRLALVLVCFVVCERALTAAADFLEARTGLHKKRAIAAILVVIASALGAAGVFAVRALLPHIRDLRSTSAQFAESITQSPLLEQARHALGMEDETLTHALRDHVMTALRYAGATAHTFVYLALGFALALMYLFDREEIDRWWRSLDPRSLAGTLARHASYVSDAIAVTVKMQVIIALVNALVTLPVLLLLRLPHVVLLFTLLLVSGLLPVIGGIASGLVLCLVAYNERGPWAVGVFLVTTAILGKVESYYLAPRLAAEHVRLPSFVIVLNLLLFEHLFGFAGLFLSFPFLYVASRIAHEWHAEADSSVSASSAPPVLLVAPVSPRVEPAEGAPSPSPP